MLTSSEPQKTTIHFLHIGKTGGSAIHAALALVRSEFGIQPWGHEQKIPHITPGEKIFFAVRDPISRYISGFNSRLRKGRPRNNNEWSAKERIAFERFSTPNKLAEALSSGDPDELAAAHHAMSDIEHVRDKLAHWLVSRDYLFSRADDIVQILSQDDLDADFERLKKALDLPRDLALPRDEIAAHKTPVGFSTVLSDTGRRNIEAWFADDIALYHAALELRALKINQTDRSHPW